MNQRDLVMHKLKGAHKYEDIDQSYDTYGRTIVNQKCKVCGYVNKVIQEPVNSGFYGSGTSTWVTNSFVQPWGSSFANGSNLTMSGTGGAGGSGGMGGGAGGAIHFAGNVPLVVGANPPNTNVTVKKGKKWFFSNIFGK